MKATAGALGRQPPARQFELRNPSTIVHEQEKRECEKACPAMANQEYTDDHRQHDRHKLKQKWGTSRA
jgi:hypothetical protein